MNERIKKIRKALDMTQQDFANKIGITQNTYANYEIGRRNPSNSVINNICKTFNVNEEWLRSGTGEMFTENNDDITMAIDHIMTNENEFHKTLFKTFAKLDERELLALEGIIDKFIAVKHEVETSREHSSFKNGGDALEEAEDAYIKSRSDSAQKTGLSASIITDDTGERKDA